MATPGSAPGPSVRGAEWTLLAVLIAVGAAARLFDLGSLPLGAPETEEGTSWLATAGQMAHGLPILPSGFAYWKGWPYTLLATGTSRVFGLSEFSLRLPSALAGIAAIWLAWWAARSTLRMLGVRAVLAAAASLVCAYVLAFSEWSILMSRNARFYELGLMLFIAGGGAAVQAFAREDVARLKWVVLFGALTVLAAATFHMGVLLLVALAWALAMGYRPRRPEALALGAMLVLVGLWFAGVAFVWKTGHVEGGTGSGDVAAALGPTFWKTLLIIAPCAWAWFALSRRKQPGRAVALAATVVAALTSLLVAVPVTGRAGLVRSFRVLAGGHPGLMILAAAGLVSFALAARAMGRPARTTAGLLWSMAIVPAALVGASSGHFTPRYLLFALGPLAVAAAAGLAVALDHLPRAVPRWVGVAAMGTVPFALLPSVGPRAAAGAALLQAGDRVPVLFAASPSRPYAMDVARPSRWVGARLREGDLVVSTSRSITQAVIGRTDFWYCHLHPSNIYLDEQGRPRSLITGCPVLHDPSELPALCADHRVWVIVDPQSEAFPEVAALERWLDGRARPSGLRPEPGRALVFLIPRGCGP